jgi:hypothetical protein
VNTALSGLLVFQWSTNTEKERSDVDWPYIIRCVGSPLSTPTENVVPDSDRL